MKRGDDLKILFLSPNQIDRYNWGHQLFRNEIGRQTPTTYYGPGFPHFNPALNVKGIINRVCPDVDLIMTYGWRYSKEFEGLGDINIPKAHITVDYVETANIPVQNKFFKKNKYDLVFAISPRAAGLLEKNNICDKIRIIPFSVDTSIYKRMKIPKERLILAAFTERADIYPKRKKIQRIIKSMNVPVVTKRIIQRKLVTCINKCKIIVTSNNIYNSLSMRYTETLACGGFLLADRPTDLDLVGLKDGKHLVIYNDVNDLKDKIRFYLEYDKERQKIEQQGMDFVRKNHSCKKRVSEMLHYIKEDLKIG